MDYEKFCQRARDFGWELDVSPETEMSDESWWRHGGTFALKREESLMEELCAPTCRCGSRMYLDRDVWQCGEEHCRNYIRLTSPNKK